MGYVVSKGWNKGSDKGYYELGRMARNLVSRVV